MSHLTVSVQILKRDKSPTRKAILKKEEQTEKANAPPKLSDDNSSDKVTKCQKLCLRTLSSCLLGAVELHSSVVACACATKLVSMIIS